MRKTIQEIIKQSIQQSLVDYFFFTLKFMVFAGMFFLLYQNIVSSQKVSPLFGDLFTGNRPALVQFLKQISPLPEFKTFFTYNEEGYGRALEYDVFREVREEHFLIANYEKVLNRNPKSRDALYNLYLLYRNQKNGEKAQHYLQRAREIDPML